MFWLLASLASIYLPVMGAAAATYRRHPVSAAIWACALTSLWLWMMLTLAT